MQKLLDGDATLDLFSTFFINFLCYCSSTFLQHHDKETAIFPPLDDENFKREKKRETFQVLGNNALLFRDPCYQVDKKAEQEFHEVFRSFTFSFESHSFTRLLNAIIRERLYLNKSQTPWHCSYFLLPRGNRRRVRQNESNL